MYCGDEVSAIIGDLGSSSFKAGFAGEDCPKAYFPSVVGIVDEDCDMVETDVERRSESNKKYRIGHAIHGRKEDTEIKQATNADGLIGDWETVEHLWNHAFDSLQVDSSEYALLVTEPSRNSRESRVQLCELLFEKFDIPAMFLAKSGVLASFASGRGTSLVVECGHSTTTISPIHDGFLLKKSLISSPISGSFLSKQILSTLTSNGTEIRPRCTFEKRVIEGQMVVNDIPCDNITDSYLQFARQEIIDDIKHSIFRVSEAALDDSATSLPPVQYELPDGQTLEFGAERFSVPELFFNPFPLSMHGVQPLQSMVVNSVSSCDPDVRRELMNNVILTGGSSLFEGMPERLHRELNSITPSTLKVRVISAGNQERLFSTFIGGSILASLGSFQQLWMSKQEYAEFGPNKIDAKCP